MLYFLTFGNLNKPAKSMVGIVAAFFNEDRSIVRITSYPFINYSLDYKKFNITIAGNRVYKTGSKYIINYKTANVEIEAIMESKGKPFGGVNTNQVKKMAMDGMVCCNSIWKCNCCS